MEDSVEYPKSGYIRQRRNLIGMSLMLFAYLGAGITINQLNLLGNEFLVSNPSAVPKVLWLIWFYFLVRYYQHWRLVGPVDLKSAYHEAMQHFVPIAAFEIVKRQLRKTPEKEEQLRGYTLSMGNPSIKQARPKYWKVVLDYSAKAENEITSFPTESATVSGQDLTKAKRQSLRRVILNTPYVTEHVLPYLIALVPVGYWIYSLPLLNYLPTLGLMMKQHQLVIA